LSQLEVQLRHEERTSQEIDQAQAVPQATRTLLIWLPVVSFVLAQIMGLGTFSGILHPVGALAALLAGALLFAGYKFPAECSTVFCPKTRPNLVVDGFAYLPVRRGTVGKNSKET